MILDTNVLKSAYYTTSNVDFNTLVSSITNKHSYFKILFWIIACNCNEFGAMDSSCNNNGICACMDNYGGHKCDSCIEGFFGFPNCQGMQYDICQTLNISNMKSFYRL